MPSFRSNTDTNGVKVGYTSWLRMESDYGSPYYHIHRADFHRLLYDLVADTHDVTLRLGSTVKDVYPGEEGGVLGENKQGCGRPFIKLASGEVVEGDLVVAADGVKSIIRQVSIFQLWVKFLMLSPFLLKSLWPLNCPCTIFSTSHYPQLTQHKFQNKFALTEIITSFLTNISGSSLIDRYGSSHSCYTDRGCGIQSRGAVFFTHEGQYDGLFFFFAVIRLYAPHVSRIPIYVPSLIIQR
jgi:hypothetical protein